MNCPHCGAEDSVEVLVDAYVAYACKGFDDLGHPEIEGDSLRTDEFDDRFAQCRQCGKTVESGQPSGTSASTTPNNKE